MLPHALRTGLRQALSAAVPTQLALALALLAPCACSKSDPPDASKEGAAPDGDKAGEKPGNEPDPGTPATDEPAKDTAAPPSTEAEATGPRPASLEEIEVVEGCRKLDLTAWRKTASAANTSLDIFWALARAGLLPNTALLDEETTLTRDNVTIEVQSMEIDGKAPAEDLVVVRLDPPRGPDSVLAGVFLHGDGGQRCPVGVGELSVVWAHPAAEASPLHPHLESLVQFEPVELIAAGQHAIAVTTAMGEDSSDPAVSSYNLSYYVLDGDVLSQVFGPFGLYEKMTSSYIDDPIVTGRVELQGGFPKAIVAETSTDCSPLLDSCKRNPEACADMEIECKTGKESKTWRWVDGEYTVAR